MLESLALLFVPSPHVMCENGLCAWGVLLPPHS